MSTQVPTRPHPERHAEASRRLRDAGQDHVLRFWDELTSDGQSRLLDQIEEIDFDRMRGLHSGDLTVAPEDLSGSLSPAEVLALDREPQVADRKAAYRRGEELLRQGKVGVFLVAGGQGSRLGFSGPKGCFRAGPLSQATIFELHAHKLLHLGRKYGHPLPWYIMTSQQNDRATREFFEEHDCFGLRREDVRFLPQAMMPALDEEGRLILEEKDSIFRSPNGHGGAFEAFARGGGLDDAAERGIEQIFYFQVDNILIRIADPLYAGLHDLYGSEMSLKVLEKTGPDEKIGVVALVDGSPHVVEYSDLPASEAERRDESGRLVHWAGSIAIHIFTLDFMRRVADGAIRLPYHVARKKVRGIDDAGNSAEIAARKFETFVFDALPAARRHLSVEVVREQEFAPIKNAEGVDSAITARELMIEEHRRWLRTVGVDVHGRVEISALVATDPQDLAERRDELADCPRQGDVLIEVDTDGSTRFKTL